MISIHEAAEKLGLEIGDVRDLMQEFLGCTRDDLAAMTDALEAGRADVLRERGHFIKGAALNLALQETAGIASMIEQAGKIGRIEDARPLLDMLARNLDRLKME
jgi:HPt (histidine-containing phosphotransfer) domain-containing protein